MEQSNFDDYPLLRMDPCPAIYATSGRRIRRLPFAKSGLKLGRSRLA